MLSEKLSDCEKVDRLHAFIPPDSCKIDNLSQVTKRTFIQTTPRKDRVFSDASLGNGFRSGPLSPSAGTPSAFLGHQAILGQAKIARPRTKRGRLR
jgi:hypothetical protein